MQVRPCANAEEMRAAFAPIWHYFGQHPPTGDAIKHFDRVLEPERVHRGLRRRRGGRRLGGVRVRPHRAGRAGEGRRASRSSACCRRIAGAAICAR